MSTSLVYAAASSNVFSQVADVSPSSSLIAFGSSSLIVLWDLEVRQSLYLKNKVNTYLSELRRHWSIKNSSQDAGHNHLHSILSAKHLALYKRGHWHFERLEKGNTSGQARLSLSRWMTPIPSPICSGKIVAPFKLIQNRYQPFAFKVTKL